MIVPGSRLGRLSSADRSAKTIAITPAPMKKRGKSSRRNEPQNAATAPAFTANSPRHSAGRMTSQLSIRLRT